MDHHTSSRHHHQQRHGHHGTSTYSTMRVMAPVYYDHHHPHHQNMAPGVYATPILVATPNGTHRTLAHHHQLPPVNHEMYNSRARHLVGYSTVSAGSKNRSMSVSSFHHAPMTATKSSGNGSSSTKQPKDTTKSNSNWFTWKRKSSSDKPEVVDQQQRRCSVSGHISEYCPAASHHHSNVRQSKSSVPPSLAKLFQPTSSQSTASNSTTQQQSQQQSSQLCICRGLTESTFMVPDCFSGGAPPTTTTIDQRQQSTPKKVGKLFSKSGTVKSISTGSLLIAAGSDGGAHQTTFSSKNKRFATLNSKSLSNKSLDHLDTANRKSILECDINPYELIDENPVAAPEIIEKQHKSRSRSANSTKSRFHASNSVRIAGQSVFSNFYDSKELEIVETPARYSTISDGEPLSLPVGNFHSVLIEPEPDYDDEEGQTDVCREIIQKLPQRPKGQHRPPIRRTSQIPIPPPPPVHQLTLTKKSSTSSVTRPKACPPPPPLSSNPLPPSPPQLPKSNSRSIPPPAPPLPPPNFLDDVLKARDRKPSEIARPKKRPEAGTLVKSVSQPEISFQNELKLKLNQGVKSILKKTEVGSSSSSDNDSNSSQSNESSSSFESRIQQFEKSNSAESNKPKKSVHFRLRKTAPNQLSRSRSTSHIITETIHEEDDEHCFYDDVATSVSAASTTPTTALSVDNIANIVSISSITSHVSSSPTPIQDNNVADADQVQSFDVGVSSSMNGGGQSQQVSEHLYDDSAIVATQSLFDLEQSIATSTTASTVTTTITTTTTIITTSSNNGVISSTSSVRESPPVRGYTATTNSIPVTLDSDVDEEIGEFDDDDDDDDTLLKQQKPVSRSAISSSCLAQTAAAMSDFAAKHRFNVNTSPTPPPIPARRLLEANDDEEQFELTTPKSARSYSSGSGSVRSLLAKKLNRPQLTSGSNTTRSSSSSSSSSYSANKLNIRHFFDAEHSKSLSTPTSESSVPSPDASSHNIGDYDQKNAAEEHIYEELDTVLVEAKHHAKFLSRLQRSSYKVSTNDAEVVSTTNESPVNTLEHDSGTSSFGDSLADSSIETFNVAPHKKSTNSRDSKTATSRRNRVSNLSNSSTESSNSSSGVPSSLSDDIGDDSDDMITNSSSSLGSMGADQTSSGSNSCYYETCQPPEILERRDSGVGADLKRKNFKTRETLCFDCNLDIHESQQESSDDSYYFNPYNQSFLCQRCEKLRNERKEIVTEIVDTEIKYGRDLKIILEEFARPINAAGLLTAQQVDEIFLNLDELIEVNEHFSERLQEAVNAAYDQEDEDLTSIQIGELFTECFLARISVIEEYCIRQGSASLLLNQLEKDKELLRIFLKVSQMENPLLRRMNLRSFLVVPVQRVTKYPLLLARLHKVTSHHHPDRDRIHDAQLKLEFYLDAINQKTKGSIAETTSRLWRRISNLSSTSMRSKGAGGSGTDLQTSFDDFGFVRLKKTALDQLKWSKEESRFVLISRVSYMVDKSTADQGSHSVFNLTSTTSPATPNDSFWSKTLKFSPACAVLVTLNTPSPQELNSSSSPASGQSGQDCSEPNSLTLSEGDAADQQSSHSQFASITRRNKSPVRLLGSSTVTSKLNTSTTAREAVLLLFKEKNGRYSPCRESINLSMCVIASSVESENDEFIEISEIESRDTILLKSENNDELREWLEQLRSITSQLGNWRRRRNALPNIMALRNLLDLVDNDQHF